MQDTKIIFFGTPEFGGIVLEELVENGYKPVLVITEPDKPVGRKQILSSSPVKVIAQKYNIPVRHLISDIGKPDLIIVASYGKILPKAILDLPRYGCLNVHPSLLPKYRGPSPIQTAILSGDTEIGVSIIKMTEKIDAGPIVSELRFKIYDLRMTYKTLHDELAKLGAELLVKTIPDWLAGKIKAEPQDETKATYTKILKKEDGLIDWEKPAEYIERQVRALNPWPGTYTFYRQKRLKILKTEIKNNKLIIKEVQLEGKKPMAFEEFLRGHQDYAGLQ